MSTIQKRFVQFLLITSLIICTVHTLIWAFSPIVIRHFANSALKAHSANLTPESNIRYNPFISTLSIEGLRLSSGNGEHFSIDTAKVHLQLRKLFAKTLAIKNIEIDGITLNIAQQKDQLVVGGINIPKETPADTEKEKEQLSESPDSDKSQSPFSLNLQKFSLNNTAIQLVIDDVTHQLDVKELVINSLYANQQVQHGELKVNGQIDKSPFSIDTVFDIKQLTGIIDSSITLSDYELAKSQHIIQENIEALQGKISLASQFSVHLGNEKHTITTEEVEIILTELDLEKTPWFYTSEREKILIRDVNLALFTDGKIDLTTAYSLSLRSGTLSLSNKENIIASWKSIDTTDATFNLDDSIAAEIPFIELSELRASQPSTPKQDDGENNPITAPLVFVNQVRIENIDASDKHLHIKHIGINQLNATAQIDKNKQFTSLVSFDALSSNTTSSATNEATTKTTSEKEIEGEQTQRKNNDNDFIISLESLSIDKGSSIFFSDQSVSPNFENRYEIQAFKLGKIDSSMADQPTPINIQLLGDDYSRLEFSGDVFPFTDRLNAETLLKITEVSLPPLSPYIEETLGFDVESGQLNTELSLQINNDLLDGKNVLHVRGLKMGVADSNEESALKDGQAMPLNIALNMLKDKKDNLKLTIPIDGNIDDPSFGLRHFVALVIKKAAMSQAKSYLINTFVPYAQVVSVALIGADQLLKVRVEPLTYVPGQLSISESQETYVGQLAQLLIDKPKLYVKTCAVSTHADIDLPERPDDYSQQQLEALKMVGQEREKILKEALINRGIESARILFCQPVAASDPSAQPRIEIKAN